MNRLSNYKLWIAVFFLNYVFIDLIRRFFINNKIMLIALDINLIIVYLFFFLKEYQTINNNRYNKTIKSLFFLVGLICFFQLFNISMFDIITSLAGLRSYLIAVPLLWIGYHVAQKNDTKALQDLSRTIWLLSLLSIGFALYLYYGESTSSNEAIALLLEPMGHKVHGFGSAPQRLISSFFASSWRFSMFLLASYLLLSGMAKHQGRSVFPYFLIFGAGFFMSGNRAHFSLFFTYNLFLLLASLKASSRLTLVYIALILILSYKIINININNLNTIFISKSLETRIDYMIDEKKAYKDRFKMAFPFLRINTQNPYLLFGLGLGKFGSESLLRPSIGARTYPMVYLFFNETYEYPVADSGWAKIMIEMGLIGVFAFLLFYGTFIVGSLVAVVKAVKQRDYVMFSIAAFPICWLLSFSKGHPTISDIGASSFLYLAVGFTMAKLEFYSLTQRQFLTKNASRDSKRDFSTNKSELEPKGAY